MKTKVAKQEMRKGFATYIMGGLLYALWIIAALPLAGQKFQLERLGKFDNDTFVAYGAITMNGKQFQTYFLTTLFSIVLAKLGHLLIHRGDNQMRASETKN